jgi:leader peptidase (prepilin peptidase)/N-methyltransferase
MTVFSIIVRIYAGLLGAIFGSLANVIITRLPEGKDLVWQRSHCPQCLHLIKWYQNIPIVSYLFLRGKCAYCKLRIPLFYLVVELVMALAAAYLAPVNLPVNDLFWPNRTVWLNFLTWMSWSYLGEFVFHFALLFLFICMFVIDVHHRILPDSLNLLLALILFGTALALGQPLSDCLKGGTVGFMFPLLFTWLYYKMTKKVGLGGGDIKLFGALGLYLGAQGIVNTIFLSCALGSVVGIPIVYFSKEGRDYKMAFGPFIIIVASFQLFTPTLYQKLISSLWF